MAQGDPKIAPIESLIPAEGAANGPSQRRCYAMFS